MTETSGRLLRLLSLLQAPREWPGPELARRLAVTTRTVRNDVDRLRQLGYPVEATRGAVGGYRLAAGTAMPPLLLDDEEAVAVALSLRAAAAGGGVGDVEETALRALTKLQQVLPARLARRVDALQTMTARLPTGPPRGPRVDAGLLATLAGAARDREIVRFAYADRSGAASERRVEPYRLVNLGRRWYLVAFDVGRTDWRTFRVDRLTELRGVAHRFRARPLPADDIARWVADRTRSVPPPFTAQLLVRATPGEVAERVGRWHIGNLEAVGMRRTRVTMGARSAPDLAPWLATLELDFEIVDAPELAAAVRAVGRRLLRASG